MTREKWAKLSAKEQRIKVAELCGFTNIGESNLDIEFCLWGISPDTKQWKEIPEYLSDLNAMHEAEKMLQDDKQEIYAGNIIITCGFQGYKIAHATAAQRAEAFVLTMETK